MDLEAARKALVQESRELLSEMEVALLRMEKDGFDDESVHAVFRAAHTIKGSVGLFGLEHVVKFTHVLESVLDEIRSGKLLADTGMISLFLQCGDHLLDLVGGIEAQTPETDAQATEGERLIGLLKALRPGGNRSLVAPAPIALDAQEIEPGPDGVAGDAWHISLRLASDVLKAGMDPLSFFRYLASMGEILGIEVLDDRLPPVDQMDPEELYLGFELQFRSDVSRKAIEDVFEFVAEGSKIRILPPHGRIEEYKALIEALPESPKRLGEILVAIGALTERELERVLELQVTKADRPVIGSLLVAEQMVPPAVVAAALHKQKGTRERSIQENRVVKVDARKLDALIDLVGELVIANAAAKIAAVGERAKRSEEAIETLTVLVENIRDAALGMRMVPIGEVFHRFPRLVRDLASELGKNVELVIQGAETELDKSMVERINDPLTHMVRNSLDHAIESEAVRVALGKPAKGTLKFNAYHETGSIVIEVSDDGTGIDRKKVVARAVERGIVQPGQELTDREIHNLIFEPGFSTAETVTNLSGRGVGMDVVKRSIEALRGEIEIESEEGVGAVFRLRMPLTLAIIDGFLVGVGGRSFVVPMDLVKECADLVVSNIHGDLVVLRGESLPFIRLRDLFKISGSRPERESLVVVQYGLNRIGLVVDQLAGELQAVIKPMGMVFRDLKAIGGTTILGNGSVALILDVPHLSQVVSSRSLAA